MNGSSASREFVEWIAAVIRGRGFTCTINDPYTGGEINGRYGAPEDGIDTVMVEINKKRFMDVATFRRNEGFTTSRPPPTPCCPHRRSRSESGLAINRRPMASHRR